MLYKPNRPAAGGGGNHPIPANSRQAYRFHRTFGYTRIPVGEIRRSATVEPAVVAFTARIPGIARRGRPSPAAVLAFVRARAGPLLRENARPPIVFVNREPRAPSLGPSLSHPGEKFWLVASDAPGWSPEVHSRMVVAGQNAWPVFFFFAGPETAAIVGPGCRRDSSRQYFADFFDRRPSMSSICGRMNLLERGKRSHERVVARERAPTRNHPAPFEVARRRDPPPRRFPDGVAPRDRVLRKQTVTFVSSS